MQIEIPARAVALAAEHAAGDGLDVEAWIASAVTAEAMRRVAAPCDGPEAAVRGLTTRDGDWVG